MEVMDGILIWDEPLGSLEAVRRGNVVRPFHDLRDVFSQIVVISHVADTREMVDHAVELA